LKPSKPIRSCGGLPPTPSRAFPRPSAHIPDDWLADYPTEPWAQIKGIGNRIRHEYFRLDDAILWQVITTDTHALKAVMEAMLARHCGEGGSGAGARGFCSGSRVVARGRNDGEAPLARHKLVRKG
jgi:Ribonuclease HepT-like